jgi:hypothetical protein
MDYEAILGRAASQSRTERGIVCEVDVAALVARCRELEAMLVPVPPSAPAEPEPEPAVVVPE